MKKILSMLMVIGMLLSVVGCEEVEFVEYPHEYMGIVEIKVKSSGVRMGNYVSSSGKVKYQVDCSKDNSAFNRIIFTQSDGDEDFKLFLAQNVGRKVKIKVNVIAQEGEDHEASYGTFEIVDYEVIK